MPARAHAPSLDRDGSPLVNRAIGPVIGIASQAVVVLVLCCLQSRGEIIKASKVWKGVLVLVGMLALGGAGLGGLVAVELLGGSGSLGRNELKVLGITATALLAAAVLGLSVVLYHCYASLDRISVLVVLGLVQASAALIWLLDKPDKTLIVVTAIPKVYLVRLSRPPHVSS